MSFFIVLKIFLEIFKFFSKIKYRCLIGLLGCIVLFVTGCGTADEAIVLIPPGESVAEFPELEAAEQAAWKCRRAAERRKPCDWSEV